MSTYRMLRPIEKQTEGMMKYADFAGGGAESPYCLPRKLCAAGTACCGCWAGAAASLRHSTIPEAPSPDMELGGGDTEAAQKKRAETASLDEF